MKFTNKLVATVLALASASSASIIRRDEWQSPSEQNATLSQYPNITNIGEHNGTWFLTALTSNLYNVYNSSQQSLNATLNCIQFNFTSSSNTSFDVLGSGFLQNNGSDTGVNGTAAGALFLQKPDDNTNTTDHELLWAAYFSQIFVNQDAWENFTNPSNDTSSYNSTSGSRAVPGSQPLEASVYSKYIDSTGNNDDSKVDTLFLWATSYQLQDASLYNKRDGDSIYGVILSKSSHVDDDTFNKTLSYLPAAIQQNNITLVNLNDTCSH